MPMVWHWSSAQLYICNSAGHLSTTDILKIEWEWEPSKNYVEYFIQNTPNTFNYLTFIWDTLL